MAEVGEEQLATGPSPTGEPAAQKAAATWPIVLTALVISMLMTAAAGFQLLQQEDTNRRELENTLRATHVNTLGALSSWLAHTERDIRAMAESRAVNPQIRSVVSAGPDAAEALSREVSLLIGDQLDKSSEFVVLDGDDIVWLSSNEADVGKAQHDLSPDLISAARTPPRLQAFEAPHNSDESGQKAHRTLDIATAVQAPDGEVEAILVVRLDPEDEFTEILQRGRLGDSGETYAVNAIGDLISLSRFDGQLFSVGLVDSGESGLLNISIRNPGGDMTQGFESDIPRDEQPLTKMAEDVLSGNSDINLESYRDYRGVPVIGIWTWDQRHQLGITTEIDAEEAFVPFWQARFAALISTALTLLLVLVLVFVFLRNRRTISAANLALDMALVTVRRLMSRMQGELDIGREIQMGMLPQHFPAFPDRHEFVVNASLEPAREVGGDLFDFFLVDEEHLCFLVGDVSDKGVPAALFMAVTKTLIKSQAMSDADTASIMTHVNDELAENNESSMFVTVFLAILDTRSGRMTYTNAGHNPPYVKKADGTVITLDDRHGPVAGAIESITFGSSEITLERGDYAVLYTDGVTEAMDVDHMQFTDAVLEKLIADATFETPEDVVALINENVAKHRGEAEQSDDITVLALRYTGPDRAAARLDLTAPATLESLGAVMERFGDFAEEHGLDDTLRRQVLLALDDLLNNIATYAYEGVESADREAQEIEIRVELTPSRLIITISDSGVPFNPFGMNAPDVQASIEERDIGGLGIHLVRTVMDEVNYSRRAGRNVVTVVKRLEPDVGEGEGSDEGSDTGGTHEHH
jgi:sigma-B regulation protein RsbU (phosphoserine phosphatase)